MNCQWAELGSQEAVLEEVADQQRSHLSIKVFICFLVCPFFWSSISIFKLCNRLLGVHEGQSRILQELAVRARFVAEREALSWHIFFLEPLSHQHLWAKRNATWLHEGASETPVSSKLPSDSFQCMNNENNQRIWKSYLQGLMPLIDMDAVDRRAWDKLVAESTLNTVVCEAASSTVEYFTLNDIALVN